MKKQLILLLAGLGMSTLISTSTHAAFATPELAILAKEGVPVAAASVHDVAEISKFLPYLFHLPRGIIKTGLGILPGISMKSGLKDISIGIAATTQVVKKTIQLPFNAASRSLKGISKISPLSYAKF